VSALDIRVEPYDGPSAQRLIDALQAEYVVRYGGPDETPVNSAEFAPPNGLFVVGHLADEPVAMGGLRRHGADEVEIKRMYVEPHARGRGLSRVMLADLERRAVELGATRVVLETGERQPEAISLYRSSGYREIEGFGHYKCMPLALSFAKSLVSSS
jgi:GNAT superfamily N-acetyltransferase